MRAAEASTGDIYVTVVAEKTQIVDAVVILRGTATTLDDRTSHDGVAHFRSVPPGAYDIIVRHPGYEEGKGRIELRAIDAEIRVTVVLPLKIIGSVRSTGNVSVTERVEQARSPLGSISSNLYDMLNRIGGANVMTAPDGALLGVSLEGKDPALTGYGFDGGVLSTPAALEAIDPDLLNSARIDEDRDQVDFYTLSPTVQREYEIRQVVGGFAARNTRLSATGTIGQTGYVIESVARGRASALDNATYLDTSGFTYRHDGFYKGGAALTKVAFPLGETYEVEAENLSAASRAAPLETTLIGDIPDGLGPNNWTNKTSNLSQVKVRGVSGRWHISSVGTAITTQTAQDFRNRFIYGRPAPSYSVSAAEINAYSASFIRSLQDHRSLNIRASLSTIQSSHHLQETTFGAILAPASASNNVSRTAGVDFIDNSNPNRFRQATLVMQGLDRGRQGIFASYHLVAKGRNGHSIFGTFGIGTKPTLQNALGRYDDPISAQYDCNTATVLAQAPNDAASIVKETSIRVGLTAKSDRRSFSAQLYQTRDRGLTLTGARVPLSVQLQTGLPAGYENALLEGYHTYGGCGGVAPPNIFFVKDLNGLDVMYRGLELTTTAQVSHRLSLQADLSYHEAKLLGGPSGLDAPQSTYRVGHQLPGIDPFDASLTLDWKLGDDRTEMVANGVYRSGNNANHLPPYALYTAGLARQISPSVSLVVVATNVTRAYAGLFTSPRFAGPLPTVSGQSLYLPATPLIQPQIYGVLTAHFGQ